MLGACVQRMEHLNQTGAEAEAESLEESRSLPSPSGRLSPGFESKGLLLLLLLLLRTSQHV